jgi:hypothetical protein
MVTALKHSGYYKYCLCQHLKKNIAHSLFISLRKIYNLMLLVLLWFSSTSCFFFHAICQKQKIFNYAYLRTTVTKYCTIFWRHTFISRWHFVLFHLEIYNICFYNLISVCIFEEWFLKNSRVWTGLRTKAIIINNDDFWTVFICVWRGVLWKN